MSKRTTRRKQNGGKVRLVDAYSVIRFFLRVSDALILPHQKKQLGIARNTAAHPLLLQMAALAQNPPTHLCLPQMLQVIPFQAWVSHKP